jgi:hypothetical protein
MREPVGALDLVATTAEVVLVVLLMKLRRDRFPKRRKAGRSKGRGGYDR